MITWYYKLYYKCLQLLSLSHGCQPMFLFFPKITSKSFNTISNIIIQLEFQYVITQRLREIGPRFLCENRSSWSPGLDRVGTNQIPERKSFHKTRITAEKALFHWRDKERILGIRVYLLNFMYSSFISWTRINLVYQLTSNWTRMNNFIRYNFIQ